MWKCESCGIFTVLVSLPLVCEIPWAPPNHIEYRCLVLVRPVVDIDSIGCRHRNRKRNWKERKIDYLKNIYFNSYFYLENLYFYLFEF